MQLGNLAHHYIKALRPSFDLALAVCFGFAFLGPCTAAQATSAPAIQTGSVSAAEVTSNSATLTAVVNPEGADTKFRVEYDTSEYSAPAPHGTSLPVGEEDVGMGAVGVSVAVYPSNLSPDTTYHFRVVATSSVEAVYSQDHSFTTQPGGSELALPDGRAWELVSPANKHGAGIESMAFEGGPIQASEDGSMMTYLAEGPIVTNPLGNRALEYSQVLSTRGPSGWASQDIATPHNELGELHPGTLSEYKLFSDNLSLGLVVPQGQTPLPPLAEDAEKTIYLRNNTECQPTSTEAIPATCYRALVTAANVLPGKEFGKEEVNNVVHFFGATSDLSHVVFESSEALTATAVKGDLNLYEWSDGKLQLVSVLPRNGKGEELPEAEGSLGYDDALVRHAISSDGTRVVWGNARGELYLRDGSTGETVALEGHRGGATFEDASNDDSKVFFTDSEPLTASSGGEGDLYVFELARGGGPLTGTIRDLSSSVGEGARVRGVISGAGEDGSYVYFVTRGVVRGATNTNAGGESALAGKDNLYVTHYNQEADEWQPRFIAALSEEDEPDWDSGENSGNLTRLTSRVSPNGKFFAFMSSKSLTGYDNRDAVSGVPDEEVYLYDAGASRTVCASCNPTGERPSGLRDPLSEAHEPPALLIDHPGAWGGHWLAGSVPGWTPEDETHALYQSRYLSSEGRLFFDSADALVPADVNGEEDVYEYEPEGVGSCSATTASASEVFDRLAGGCVALISAGSSSKESAFLDASETGDDVFFLTTSLLVPQDIDTAFDVYDAHQCTGGSPCPATDATGSSPPCSTVDSCRAAPTPQPEIFTAPPSATFSGAGNVVQPEPGAAVKPRPLTRAQKLADALRACRKKPSKKPSKKRAACEAQARRRYGPVHKARQKSAHKQNGRSR